MYVCCACIFFAEVSAQIFCLFLNVVVSVLLSFKSLFFYFGYKSSFFNFGYKSLLDICVSQHFLSACDLYSYSLHSVFAGQTFIYLFNTSKYMNN